MMRNSLIAAGGLIIGLAVAAIVFAAARHAPTPPASGTITIEQAARWTATQVAGPLREPALLPPRSQFARRLHHRVLGRCGACWLEWRCLVAKRRRERKSFQYRRRVDTRRV